METAIVCRDCGHTGTWHVKATSISNCGCTMAGCPCQIFTTREDTDMKMEKISPPTVIAKTVYETADKQHFETRGEAMRHHAWLAVRAEMRNTSKDLMLALGNSCEQVHLEDITSEMWNRWMKVYEEALK